MPQQSYTVSAIPLNNLLWQFTMAIYHAIYHAKLTMLYFQQNAKQIEISVSLCSIVSLSTLLLLLQNHTLRNSGKRFSHFSTPEMAVRQLNIFETSLKRRKRRKPRRPCLAVAVPGNRLVDSSDSMHKACQCSIIFGDIVLVISCHSHYHAKSWNAIRLI